jgi:hypothetical protein
MAEHDDKFDLIEHWTRVLMVLAGVTLFAVVLAWPEV